MPVATSNCPVPSRSIVASIRVSFVCRWGAGPFGGERDPGAPSLRLEREEDRSEVVVPDPLQLPDGLRDALEPVAVEG